MTDFERFDKALAKCGNSSEEKPEKKAGCQHLNTVDEGGAVACTDCGQEIERATDDKEWRFYGASDTKRNADPGRVQKRRTDERGIFKDVENMGFSDKIVTIANRIYQDATGDDIFRGNTRKARIFAAIYYAYKLERDPQDHSKLLEVFGLSRKVALTGMNNLNRRSPRDAEFRDVDITPVHLIPDIMDQFGATTKQKKQVKALYNLIDNTSSRLNGSRPNSVASALVYYYIVLKKMRITLNQFASTVNLSALTIDKLAKEISAVLNTPSVM